MSLLGSATSKRTLEEPSISTSERDAILNKLDARIAAKTSLLGHEPSARKFTFDSEDVLKRLDARVTTRMSLEPKQSMSTSEKEDLLKKFDARLAARMSRREQSTSSSARECALKRLDSPVAARMSLPEQGTSTSEREDMLKKFEARLADRMSLGREQSKSTSAREYVFKRLDSPVAAKMSVLESASCKRKREEPSTSTSEREYMLPSKRSLLGPEPSTSTSASDDVLKNVERLHAQLTATMSSFESAPCKQRKLDKPSTSDAEENILTKFDTGVAAKMSLLGRSSCKRKLEETSTTSSTEDLLKRSNARVPAEISLLEPTPCKQQKLEELGSSITSMDDDISKRFDAKTLRALEEIYACNKEFIALNNRACKEVIEVKQAFKKNLRPLLDQRNEIIKGIPHFWGTVFVNHSMFSRILRVDEKDCLQYLLKLQVEEFEDVTPCYKISFHFDENPYFTNDVLTKEYILGLGDKEGTCRNTDIQWKEGYDGTRKKKNPYVSANKQRIVYRSFFDWFTSNLIDPHVDVITEIIMDEIWDNPYAYYNFSTDDEDNFEDDTSEEEESDESIGVEGEEPDEIEDEEIQEVHDVEDVDDEEGEEMDDVEEIGDEDERGDAVLVDDDDDDDAEVIEEGRNTISLVDDEDAEDEGESDEDVYAEDESNDEVYAEEDSNDEIYAEESNEDDEAEIIEDSDTGVAKINRADIDDYDEFAEEEEEEEEEVEEIIEDSGNEGYNDDGVCLVITDDDDEETEVAEKDRNKIKNNLELKITEGDCNEIVNNDVTEFSEVDYSKIKISDVVGGDIVKKITEGDVNEIVKNDVTEGGNDLMNNDAVNVTEGENESFNNEVMEIVKGDNNKTINGNEAEVAKGGGSENINNVGGEVTEEVGNKIVNYVAEVAEGCPNEIITTAEKDIDEERKSSIPVHEKINLVETSSETSVNEPTVVQKDCDEILVEDESEAFEVENENVPKDGKVVQ